MRALPAVQGSETGLRADVDGAGGWMWNPAWSSRARLCRRRDGGASPGLAPRKKNSPPPKKTKKTDRGRDRAEQGAVLVLHGRGGGGRLRLVIRYGLT